MKNDDIATLKKHHGFGSKSISNIYTKIEKEGKKLPVNNLNKKNIVIYKIH